MYIDLCIDLCQPTNLSIRSILFIATEIKCHIQNSLILILFSWIYKNSFFYKIFGDIGSLHHPSTDSPKAIPYHFFRYHFHFFYKLINRYLLNKNGYLQYLDRNLFLDFILHKLAIFLMVVIWTLLV